MDREGFKDRTKKFALRVIRLVESLPRTRDRGIIGGQLLRAGTSVGANYRAACRGRSRKDVISKLGIVLEEADESLFWMELLIEGNLVKTSKMTGIMQEANEIVAMLVASVKTMRAKGRSAKSDI